LVSRILLPIGSAATLRRLAKGEASHLTANARRDNRLRHKTRWLAIIAPLAVTALFAAAQSAQARVVGAYILFELGGPSMSGAAEGIRSVSLANCKTTTIGQNSAAELVVHLDCDERDEPGATAYLDQAVMKLGQVNGVRRAYVLAIRIE
jgi:hypothetical protein